jgi:hypothetical protein
MIFILCSFAILREKFPTKNFPQNRKEKHTFIILQAVL